MARHCLNSLLLDVNSGVGAGDAGDAAASSSKNFCAKLIRFGRNLSKLWAKVIRFGQNQNLASPNTFDLLRLWMITSGKSHFLPYFAVLLRDEACATIADFTQHTLKQIIGCTTALCRMHHYTMK